MSSELTAAGTQCHYCAGSINGYILSLHTTTTSTDMNIDSNIYTNELKRNGINISMTEENHCYENAMAERVNGILKDEFYLDQTFSSMNQAKIATKNAIKLYNSKRLHLSLDFNTPNSIHLNAA